MFTRGYLLKQLRAVKEVKALRGKGLMIGLELHINAEAVRKVLFEKYHILTGVTKGGRVIRLLPPLTIHKKHIDIFIEALKGAINMIKESENSKGVASA